METLDANELSRLNGLIKRRLLIRDKKNYTELVDALGNKIDPAYIVGLDNITTFEHALPAEYFKLGDICDLRGSRQLTRDQVQVLLGYDFFKAQDDNDIRIMLEALRGGFGGSRSNAYLLGDTAHRSGVLETPVAFYMISNESHKRLHTPESAKRGI